MKFEKNSLRKHIAEQKDLLYSELASRSEEVIMVLEATDTFCRARNVLLYNSLPDEVSTQMVFEKYVSQKNFFLPVISDGHLKIRKYTPETSFSQTTFGIQEPMGEDITDLQKIDLVIVPGIAFDFNLNRLGRGKGHYDKFLKTLKAKKIGLAFDFQMVEKIPTEAHDVAMDMVVTENEIICNGVY